VDLTIRRGQGDDGSDRVFITWPAGAIVNKWLKVVVKATAATGLSGPDIFYFGHLLGESGDTAAAAAVTAGDYAIIYDHRSEQASITSWYDINRDGRVSFIDAYISWQQLRGSVGPVLLLIAP
jgi:hypothetical protein